MRKVSQARQGFEKAEEEGEHRVRVPPRPPGKRGCGACVFPQMWGPTAGGAWRSVLAQVRGAPVSLRLHPPGRVQVH